MSEQIDRADENAVPDADVCPNPKCLGCFDGRCVKKMTQDQVDLLEAGVCPFCGWKLQ